MKNKHAVAHMKAAYIYADLSSCNKRKVGCLIVKDDTPIAIGYNGTPSGEDNCCEDEFGESKPNVIHAEDNALRKLTRCHESSVNASVFITVSPCKRCAEMLTDAKVSEVYYAELYHGRNRQAALDHLHKHGVETIHLEV